MLMEEHHKWNVMIWFIRCLFCFPTNFVVLEGSLVGIGGHVALCRMTSLVSLVKSRRERKTICGKLVIFRGGGWSQQ
jgi:hypothetical protein